MPWDTSLRKKKTNREIAEILLALFKCGQTKRGVAYTLGGVYVGENFGMVSKKALWAIRENAKAGERGWTTACIKGNRVKYFEFPKVRSVANGRSVIDKKHSVTIEHTIPIDALYKEFERRGSKLTLDDILALIPKMQVALIRDDENDILNAKFKSSMPEGWWSSKLDPLERYRQAGLADEIWDPRYTIMIE